MKIVGPPPHGIYRVSRIDLPVFTPAGWPHSGRNRFDHPLRSAGHDFDPDLNFHVIYGASSLTAAFVETLQALRPSLHAIAGLRETALEESVDRLAGRISAQWRARRHWGTLALPGLL
jgi:hypothetical protein